VACLGRKTVTPKALATPPSDSRAFPITAGTLQSLRRFVAQSATVFGLGDDRVDDLVLATNEVATNSILHGGGTGTLQMWVEQESVTCEIRDKGWIRDSILRRPRPPAISSDGRGLWIARKLCDRVEILSSRSGSTVRLHMGLG